MSDVHTTSRYELMYIIPATITDEEAGTVETKISALVTKYGGTVESTKRLGKLRLAYAIGDHRHGFYVLVHFSADHSSVAKIEENLRISTDIIRHMILRAEEAGEGKYNLVEYKEINLDAKDDRPRRPRTEEKAADAAPVSVEEVDKKSETALSEDTTTV